MASMKQIKIIDKAKKEAERAEPSSEMKANVERLQRYIENFLNNQNVRVQIESKSSPDSEASFTEGVDQPEVESLMPKVYMLVFLGINSANKSHSNCKPIFASIRTHSVTI